MNFIVDLLYFKWYGTLFVLSIALVYVYCDGKNSELVNVHTSHAKLSDENHRCVYDSVNHLVCHLLQLNGHLVEALLDQCEILTMFYDYTCFDQFIPALMQNETGSARGHKYLTEKKKLTDA